MDKTTPSATPFKVKLFRGLIARGLTGQDLMDAFIAAAADLGLPPEVGAAACRGCLRATVEDMLGRGRA